MLASECPMALELSLAQKKPPDVTSPWAHTRCHQLALGTWNITPPVRKKPELVRVAVATRPSRGGKVLTVPYAHARSSSSGYPAFLESLGQLVYNQARCWFPVLIRAKLPHNNHLMGRLNGG